MATLESFPIGKEKKFGEIDEIARQKGDRSFLVYFIMKEQCSKNFLWDILKKVPGHQFSKYCGQSMCRGRMSSVFFLTVSNAGFPATRRSPLPYVAAMIEEQLILAANRIARIEAIAGQVNDNTRYKAVV